MSYVVNESNIHFEYIKDQLNTHINLIIRPDRNLTQDEAEQWKQRIVRDSTWMRWLDEKNLELVFCMFGCKPYIRSKLECDEHFETKCKGNPEVTTYE